MNRGSTREYNADDFQDIVDELQLARRVGGATFVTMEEVSARAMRTRPAATWRFLLSRSKEDRTDKGSCAAAAAPPSPAAAFHTARLPHSAHFDQQHGGSLPCWLVGRAVPRF